MDPKLGTLLSLTKDEVILFYKSIEGLSADSSKKYIKSEGLANHYGELPTDDK